MNRRGSIAELPFNYSAVGITRLGTTYRPPGYRVFDRTVEIGFGGAHWDFASRAVLHWGIKSRSGFSVTDAQGVAAADCAVRIGQAYWLIANWGALRVWEPVRVVTVIDEPRRAGFAYGTLAGHPVSGEESFLVERTDDDRVTLTITSFTGPPAHPLRVAFPLVLLAQRHYRKRYFRSLSGSMDLAAATNGRDS